MSNQAAAIDQSPEDQVGAVVGSPIIIGRSDMAALVLHVLIGYPGGIAAHFGAHMREPSASREWIDDLRNRDRPAGVRLAFSYDVPAEPRPFRTSFGTEQPIWKLEGASGSELSYMGWLWISPYPPSGQLTVTCSWLGPGIEQATAILIGPRV